MINFNFGADSFVTCIVTVRLVVIGYVRLEPHIERTILDASVLGDRVNYLNQNVIIYTNHKIIK